MIRTSFSIFHRPRIYTFEYAFDRNFLIRRQDDVKLTDNT